jgi:hypothetical protein
LTYRGAAGCRFRRPIYDLASNMEQYRDVGGLHWGPALQATSVDRRIAPIRVSSVTMDYLGIERHWALSMEH